MTKKKLTAQQRASRNYVKNHKEEVLARNREYNTTHKERRDYTNGRSYAKTFIAKLGSTEDLQEIDKLIHQRIVQVSKN